MSSFIKHYPLGDATIVWDPEKCVHSASCFRKLPQVFNPRVKPWIKPDAAAPEEIIAVVQACPSGALSMLKSQPQATIDQHTEEDAAPLDVPITVTNIASTPVLTEGAGTISQTVTVVEVSKNGPLLIKGALELKFPDGTVKERSNVTALCRCGQSKSKPFCDGSHVHVTLD